MLLTHATWARHIWLLKCVPGFLIFCALQSFTQCGMEIHLGVKSLVVSGSRWSGCYTRKCKSAMKCLLEINLSIPGKFDHHFADDLFRCIFVNEKFCILIRISLKIVPKGPIDKKSALIQVMAWHWTGGKPFLHQCWSSPVHFCGTRGMS